MLPCLSLDFPARYAEWLGLGNWTPELDSVATAHHLMLYGIYNRERWCAVGNGALVKKLVELGKYEEALFGAAGAMQRERSPHDVQSTGVCCPLTAGNFSKAMGHWMSPCMM